MNETAYTTKEVSQHLEIGESTVRKWSLALEKNGYQFIRTDSNKRLFLERDLIAFKFFKNLVQEENFSLGNASKTIVSKHKGEASDSVTDVVLGDSRSPTRSPEELILELMEKVDKYETYFEQQEKFNNKLLARLEEQKTYYEERNAEREHAFMQALKETQETQKLLAASLDTSEDQEKVEEQENEQRTPLEKVSFFSRIFKRK